MDKFDVMDVNEKQRERIAELEAMIHEAKEVYAGMEGFKPETAPEGYCLQVIEQMYKELIEPPVGGGDE